MKNYILILVLALTLGVNSNFFKSIKRSHNMSGKARAAMLGVKESDKDDDSDDDDNYRSADEDDDSDDNQGLSTGSASKDKKSGDIPGEGDDD